MAAEDFLRSLFRQRRLTSPELEGRLRALNALAAGKLRPVLLPPAVATWNESKRERSPYDFLAGAATVTL